MEPIHLQYSAPALQVTLSFDTLLHTRESDFPLIRRGWFEYGEEMSFIETHDSEVLKVVIRCLFQNGTGISKINVKEYKLIAECSTAVSVEYIVEAVMEALREAGYEVILAPKPPSQKWLKEAANCALKSEPRNWLQKVWWHFFPPADPYADGEV
jgi:hypothetical protein